MSEKTPPSTTNSHTCLESEEDDFEKILNDAEIKAALSDPIVSTAFAEISTNPGNFSKYQTNQKFMDLLIKLSEKITKTESSSKEFSGIEERPEGETPPPPFYQPDHDKLK